MFFSFPFSFLFSFYGFVLTALVSVLFCCNVVDPAFASPLVCVGPADGLFDDPFATGVALVLIAFEAELAFLDIKLFTSPAAAEPRLDGSTGVLLIRLWARLFTTAPNDPPM